MKTTIAGIPCEVRATRIEVVRGTYCLDAGSPDEYYGYTEVDFDVFDLKGYPATWLEAKMSDDGRREIEYELVKEAQAEGEEP